MPKAVLLILVLLGVVACGRDVTGTPPPESDDELVAAAAYLRPVLESSFTNTYAGIEVRQETQVLVVHRKRDSRLDAEVNRLAPGVKVEFQDARYALSELKPAAYRVMDDREYWKSRGVTVTAAGPETDGSGVLVRTAEEPGDFADRLRERYPGMAFNVRRGEVAFPMDTGPAPVFPSSPVRTT